MRRVVGLVSAVVVALVIIGLASVYAFDAHGKQAKPSAAAGAAKKPAAAAAKSTVLPKINPEIKGVTTRFYSMTAGGTKRAYEIIAPVKALPKTAPVIFMFGGVVSPTMSGKAAVTRESGRDDLIPYAASGLAELVYPEPMYGSWNAIGCCAEAAAHKVNDLAFVEALVPKVDPGHARPVYAVGYSNGARLAYRFACDDPGLFDGYAMVKGEPMPGCAISKPVSIVQMASLNDPEVPYKPGDHGSVESLPVTTLVSRLRTAEKCPAKPAVTRSGEVTQTTWSGCADGTRLALAVWSGGVHAFPQRSGGVAGAAQVLWAFFTKTPVAPLP